MNPVWQWQLARWRQVLGWPGLLGLGAAFLGLLLYLFGALPTAGRVEELQTQVAEARARAALPVAQSEAESVESRLVAFYRGFPGRNTTGAWLERIYAAGTEADLALDKAAYKLSVDRDSKLLRYQIDLPVKGSYAQVRQFIQNVLRSVPTIALSDLQLQRGTIAEEELEARIRFILYLREGA